MIHGLRLLSIATSLAAAIGASGSTLHAMSPLSDSFGVALEKHLSAPLGIAAFGEFDVAIDGDTLAIGAQLPPSQGNRGVVCIFTRAGTAWTHQATIMSSDGVSGDGFGWTIALSGNLLVVGAPLHEVGLPSNAGAAYVFRRSGDDWSEQAKLIGPSPQFEDAFGGSVAVDGNTVVVGDDKWFPGQLQVGSAYVFVRDLESGLWGMQAELRPADLGQGDQFARSLALQGDTLLVGAPFYPASGTGGVFVFLRNGSVWTQQPQVLFASDAEGGARFGWDVDLDGDTAVIGSQHWNGPAALGTYYGAAYVFTQQSGVWTEQTRVSSLENNSDFAWSVGVSGDCMWVGAQHADGPDSANQGAAYLYERSNGSWSERMKVALTNDPNARQFAAALALDGDTAVVAAHQTTPLTPGLDLGAAFVYRFGKNALGTPFCFGDGSLATACPCALPDIVPSPSGASDAGCANSFDLGGAKLTASGLSSPDTLQFNVDIGPNYAGFAFLVKGNAQDVNGIVGGDGVRCVSGQLIRFGSHNAGTNGAPLGSWTYPNTAQTTPVSSATLQPAGEEAFYQLFYRNAQSGFCSPATSNFSNGFRLPWPL